MRGDAYHPTHSAGPNLRLHRDLDNYSPLSFSVVMPSELSRTALAQRKYDRYVPKHRPDVAYARVKDAIQAELDAFYYGGQHSGKPRADITGPHTAHWWPGFPGEPPWGVVR